MLKPKTKKKVIKAYAIVDRNGVIENEAVFVSNICCNADEPDSLAIYDSRNIADSKVPSRNYRIVPVEITIKEQKR